MQKKMENQNETAIIHIYIYMQGYMVLQTVDPGCMEAARPNASQSSLLNKSAMLHGTLQVLQATL